MASEELNRHQRVEQYNHQLLTSEDQYVNELETIVMYIVKPLEKNAHRCKISGGEEEVRKVFKYLSSMLQFHLTFLSVIRETISVLPDLNKYIGFITMYDDYLHHYSHILDIFAKWKSMEFRDFINMRLRHKEVKKHIDDRLCSLPWYLYRPFDRIKEYYRFLKDLEKLSKKEQDDHQLLIKTISKIRPLYKKIKANEDRLQQKTRLLEVQLQIHGNPKPIVDDERYFVYNRMCQMKRRGLPGKKYKRITIYLFNDLFLWVSSRGRFKGSYSFYSKDLDINVPKNSKKGDAIFSIGLKTEKHKRLIICADDVQRDKLMNTIIKTHQQCQDKINSLAHNNNNQELMRKLKKKQQQETHVNLDIDFSTSSMQSIDTRNTHQYSEYSVSVSDRTDVTDYATGNNGIGNGIATNHKQQNSNYSNTSSNSQLHNNHDYNNYISSSPQQSPHPPQTYVNGLEKISEANTVDYGIKMGRHDHEWNRRDTNHLKATKEADPNSGYAHNNSDSVSSVKIALNLNNSRLQNGGSITPPTQNRNSANVTPILNDVIPGQFAKATTITPEPSLSQSSVENDEHPNNKNDTNNKHKSKHKHKHRHHHHHHNNHHHKSSKSKHEQIKELRNKITALEQQLQMKNERINDLEISNKTIRQTVVLKDSKINNLQDEIQQLRMQNSTHSYRAKSMSHTLGYQRMKRASSFSISKGGKVTRTAMLGKVINGGNGTKYGTISENSKSNHYISNSTSFPSVSNQTNAKYK